MNRLLVTKLGSEIYFVAVDPRKVRKIFSLVVHAVTRTVKLADSVVRLSLLSPDMVRLLRLRAPGAVEFLLFPSFKSDPLNGRERKSQHAHSIPQKYGGCYVSFTAKLVG
jgi:hypothetical protein